jgi:hypothetical protein
MVAKCDKCGQASTYLRIEIGAYYKCSCNCHA